ncbi:hypothetical protein RhiirC2_315302 [Rhizophagus irregularis]|uniref:Uncharacterized protein n=1 Tax=Rhizophagus irregularis TaxID=588596 RepID=A0A2N1MB09_9GLOM|nr:hypothetical protein RhiirC2_315302 [Rhizophagus irregularis]
MDFPVLNFSSVNVCFCVLSFILYSFNFFYVVCSSLCDNFILSKLCMKFFSSHDDQFLIKKICGKKIRQF